MRLKFTYLLLLLFNIAAWAQNDCPEAITVCGNMNYKDLDASGIGDIQELTTNACSNPGLGDSEDNTIWFKLVIKDGGTLGFVLTPESDNIFVDFDFWLFGPNVECGALGVAERCSTTNPINAQLDYNTTGMNDTSEDYSEGPGADGDAFVEWVTVEDDDVYYLLVNRPHGFSNFAIEWTGTATFHEVPVFLNPDNIPLDMSLCDDSDGEYDQAAVFNLTVYEAMFIGSQTDVEITYHTSLNDVTTGEDPLLNPDEFVSTTGLQTIYLRMTNPITGCFDIEEFNVEIPVFASEPSDLELCDINYNGIREFDLTANEGPISGNVPGSIVTYHNTEDDAINGTNTIGPLYENQEPYESEVIWARLIRPDEECIDVISFTISVNPMPVFNNPDNIVLDIEECDDNDGMFDQAAVFDLTVHEEMFTDNQENILITYHETHNNMVLGIAPITSPAAYISTQSSKTIYVRMTNTETGCHVFEEFNIIIPVLAVSADDIMLCDINNNGIREFDLSSNDDLVANSNPDATVTYHTSLENAENGQSPVGPLYENQVPYESETIWARLEIAGENCFDIIPFTIGIFNFEEYPDITVCDPESENSLTVFDLTVNENMISGGNANVIFTYYASEADLANNNPIAAPESYMSIINPQTIYLTISNPVTGCFETQEFDIHNTALTAGEPEDLFLCDTNLNGFQVFNLTENTNLINSGNTDTVVTFYLTQQDALDDVNAIDPMHQNATAYTAETIWARVERISNPLCFDVTSFTLNINNLPVLNNPQDIILDQVQCDDDGVNDQSDIFDLTIHETMFTGNQQDVVFSYYASLQDLNDNIPIPNPNTYANITNPQTVFVQMHNTVTGCTSLPESFLIEITNPVVAGEPQDLWQCDLNLNGRQSFILSLNDDYIKNGIEGIVTYYASEEDALNEVNPLNDVHMNSTPYTGQTIWARLESTNGCLGFDITSFTISVEHLPELDYSVSIQDFSQYDNSIAVNLDNWEEFEYSIDGENYIATPYFDNLIPGLYTLYIRSIDGCRTAQEELVILNYPKFFTPNGDGINETWQVYFIYFLPKSKVSIFDRFGKLVSSFWGDHIGWDGTYNGERLPSTDYWFVIELEDGRNVKGHFAMVR